MSETVINTGTNGYSHLVLVESADANSASKLFLALTNKNEGRLVKYQMIQIGNTVMTKNRYTLAI